MLKLKLKKEPSLDAAVSSSDTKSRIKLNLSSDKKLNSNTVRLRLRPNKLLNDGFDVQAPDREEDPTVEEAIILRMLPNSKGLSSLKQACETNNFTGIEIRFDDRRHAVVSVDSVEYNAQLMDLPTISEVHKTLDRRNMFKTVDVSQVLLVTHKVGDPKPDLSELTKFTHDPHLHPHGLTPPLYNVRNRRFQKRISTKTVESLEAQVEELLKRDAEAKEVSTELLPASAVAAQQALAEAARAAAKARVQDSDMEVDEELDEELERVMFSENDDEGENDDEDGQGRSRSSAQVSASEEDDEEDVDDDDDDDEEDRHQGDQGDDLDDDVRQHNKQLREEIRELEVTIEAKAQVAGKVVNEIMRARHMDAVTRLKAELEKKKSLLRDSGGLENENQDHKLISSQADEDDDEDIVDEDDDDDDDAPELPAGAGLPEIPNDSANAPLQESSEEARLRKELSNTFGLEESGDNFEVGDNLMGDDLGFNIEELGDIGRLGELDVEVDDIEKLSEKVNAEIHVSNTENVNEEDDIDDLF